MDSGMAATAYSVIELKMVEDILRENTDERRKMFEEASGVTKYKARRRAALGKLDDVQRDLLRVNDLISEIEKKVNSLSGRRKKPSSTNDSQTNWGCWNANIYFQNIIQC